jgi:hypothetical protein
MNIAEAKNAAKISQSKRGLAGAAVLTTVGAITANLGVFGVARAVGVDFNSAQTPTVGPGTVLAVTLAAMTIGWVLAALAARRNRPQLRAMAMIGGVFAALSILGPLTLNIGIAGRLTLASLHLIAGAFYVVGVLVRSDRRATR